MGMQIFPKTSVHHVRHHDGPARDGRVTLEADGGIDVLCNNAGVVHRDLQPSNILFDEQGFIRLCDFNSSILLSVAFCGQNAPPPGGCQKPHL